MIQVVNRGNSAFAYHVEISAMKATVMKTTAADCILHSAFPPSIQYIVVSLYFVLSICATFLCHVN